MATISSHVLDSVVGTHASGIRITCFRLVNETTKENVFDVIANEEGRIVEQIAGDVAGDSRGDGAQYELVFHTNDYFKAQPSTPKARQIMDVVVVRFTIPDPNERIHIPLVLSPHAYSLWWSA